MVGLLGMSSGTGYQIAGTTVSAVLAGDGQTQLPNWNGWPVPITGDCLVYRAHVTRPHELTIRLRPWYLTL